THFDHEGENNEQAGTQEPTTSGGESNGQEEPQASTETNAQQQSDQEVHDQGVSQEEEPLVLRRSTRVKRHPSNW
ncbi:unnamed protein product, partial [Cochlearia groenlandica]